LMPMPSLVMMADVSGGTRNCGIRNAREGEAPAPLQSAAEECWGGPPRQRI
jgi:hypothetical protein